MKGAPTRDCHFGWGEASVQSQPFARLLILGVVPFRVVGYLPFPASFFFEMIGFSPQRRSKVLTGSHSEIVYAQFMVTSFRG